MTHLSDKVIQEQFGQAMIDAVAAFARRDVRSTSVLAANEFAHVADRDLRRALAETLYGARWLYKLGLALLTSNEERAAHVRIQVIDYASICEALLADLIVQAHRKGKLKGTQHQFIDIRQTRALYWDSRDPFRTANVTSFDWRIKVAEESSIVNAALAAKLHRLRGHRNTVHLTQKVMQGVRYYLGLGKFGHEVVHELIDQTAKWTKRNP